MKSKRGYLFSTQQWRTRYQYTLFQTLSIPDKCAVSKAQKLCSKIVDNITISIFEKSAECFVVFDSHVPGLDHNTNKKQ